MGTEAPPVEETNSTTSSAGEDPGQEQQGQQQDPPPGNGGSGGQQPPSSQDDGKLPDDHPLVKALAKDRQKLASATAELTELRAKSARLTQLEQELKDRPTKEAVETLQTRYDRLEAFLQAAGGPLGRALDSRSFTRDLFETDKDITELVKAFNKQNPTATSTALGSSGAAPAPDKPDMNSLLRAALKS